jgi:hypothetical protein
MDDKSIAKRDSGYLNDNNEKDVLKEDTETVHLQTQSVYFAG